MKFLADMGVSQSVVKELRNWGYDAVHVRERLPITSDDNIILDLAEKEERIVLTMDHDFGNLLYWRGSLSPSLIFFRVTDENPSSIIQKLRIILNEAREELQKGAIITVEDIRFRIRLLPTK